MFEPMEFMQSIKVKNALANAIDAMSSYNPLNTDDLETLGKLYAHACVANDEAFKEHEKREREKRKET